MKSVTEDKYDWEYARIFIEKYLEPLYLEYFPSMGRVNPENTLTEKALDVYNSLLDNTEKIVFPASRYSRKGKLIFHSNRNYQEAYDKDRNLLCKLEIDDSGLITGWKKTNKYMGEYKNGCRHGNGIEYDYGVNVKTFKKREGLWSN